MKITAIYKNKYVKTLMRVLYRYTFIYKTGDIRRTLMND